MSLGCNVGLPEILWLPATTKSHAYQPKSNFTIGIGISRNFGVNPVMDWQ